MKFTDFLNEAKMRVGDAVMTSDGKYFFVDEIRKDIAFVSDEDGEVFEYKLKDLERL